MLFSAILVEHASRRNGLDIFPLLDKVLVDQSGMGWVGKDVDVLPSSLGLPRKELELLLVLGSAGSAEEVVACVNGVHRVDRGVWGFSHRPSLGVVVGGFWVQVS
jgi:hypothetical protein